MEIFRNGGVTQPVRQNFLESLRLARPIRVSLICRTAVLHRHPSHDTQGANVDPRCMQEVLVG